MVGNDVSAMRNTNMISALEASEIDVAAFETLEDGPPSADAHVQLDSKLIGRDKNGLFKNHQSFVKLRNKINE
jgi:hypothetical protein